MPWTRNTPWRQGQLLPKESAQALGLILPQDLDTAVVIVASHDCDILQSVDKESVVEVLIGKSIDQCDGNYTAAKNSRILHLPFAGEPRLIAEFMAKDKKTIEKERLSPFTPNQSYTLSSSNRNVLQKWLASRYRRSAFSDEFERRLGSKETKLAEHIAKAVKPHPEYITAILFDVDNGIEIPRVGPDDVYILDITVLYVVELDEERAKIESIASGVGNSIRKAFEEKLFNEETGNWRFIELRSLDVVSEDALSYRQYTILRPWRLEHISLDAEPQQPIAPA